MSNTIRIKKRAASGSAGAPSSLSPSELAFNEADLKLYYGFGDNGSTPPSASSIITVGGAGAFFNKTDTRTANTVLSGPTSGSAAAPTFRALVAGDLLKLNEFTAPDGSVSLNSQKITNLATPTADGDAASKSYVDGVSQGLDIKEGVRVATTGNITLSGTQTIDGVAVSADERVLVKNQNTASENGLYLCKASSWVRTDDLAAGSDASSVFVFVDRGSVNADNGFVCSTNKGSAVVGTNNLTFVQFSGAGQITASDGLSKSGNTLSVDLKSNGGLVIESTELALKLDASSITGTLAISDGGTGATSASAARTALGLVIGTDVEPHSDKLTELATMGQTTANALADLSEAEVQILDGATVTTSELNVMDGGTSATSTTLATADRMVINDNSVMKQVALSDLVTFLEDGATSGFDINGGTY
tara:strand:- start:181 stop:1440 length:1260 start_codon:yes stop_codon:yes gene_type:complete